MSGSLKDFPYWSKCWPSAIALSNFIAKNQALIQDKQVLELATGLGLPSLVAARFAKMLSQAITFLSPYHSLKYQLQKTISQILKPGSLTGITCPVIYW